MRIAAFFSFALFAMFPLLGQAQHHWLHADPMPITKKNPLRLSIVAGDSLTPKAGSDPAKLQRFMAYQGTDSIALTESATGTTVLIDAAKLKSSVLAASVLQMPEGTLFLPAMAKQLTKEQKAILKLQDTTQWLGGVAAQRIHYVKTFVPMAGSSDKAKIFARQLDHELEIIPSKDPSEIKVGQEMVLQFLLHQRLLPNHKFTLWHKDTNGKITRSEMITGKYGMRMFLIKKPGLYLVQVSQDGPHQFGISDKITWQSLEASYLFQIAEPEKKK